jgi:FkbM family methyltransferase
MKKSLWQAIRLFNFHEQIIIFIGLVLYKFNLVVSAKVSHLLTDCNRLVKIIEHGAIINKSTKNLFKAVLYINKKPVTLYLRKYSSDVQVFELVIVKEEYNILTAGLLLDDGKSEKVIVDAGGNIGLTSIYLFAFYPNTKFIIIEPDEQNFLLLRKNLSINKITNVCLLKKALWINNEKLIINNSFRDGKNWSLTVDKFNQDNHTNRNITTEGISLQEICDQNEIVKIDLLKIDIEGAERFLFNNELFLDTVKSKVRNLIIEIHDEFEVRNTISEKMSLLSFVREECGDITLFKKNPIQHI